MKHHLTPPGIPAPTEAGVYVATMADDFIPLPEKRLRYRGMKWSRSSLLRLRGLGEIRTKEFRVTGGLKGRTFILRESLDAWIEREMSRPERAPAARPVTTAKA